MADPTSDGMANPNTCTYNLTINTGELKIESAVEAVIGAVMAGLGSGSWLTVQEAFPNEIKKYASELIQWMAAILSTGREKKLFSFSGAPEDKAIFILSSVKGALQTARVSSRNSFFQVLDTIKNDLGL